MASCTAQLSSATLRAQRSAVSSKGIAPQLSKAVTSARHSAQFIWARCQLSALSAALSLAAQEHCACSAAAAGAALLGGRRLARLLLGSLAVTPEGVQEAAHRKVKCLVAAGVRVAVRVRLWCRGKEGEPSSKWQAVAGKGFILCEQEHSFQHTR